MWSRCSILCAVSAVSLVFASPTALAQSNAAQPDGLHIELNALNDTGQACRVTFYAENRSDNDVKQAIFETVIFDASGSVVSLTLFDFRDLPSGRPRVRQFDVSGVSCDSLGKVLINGASTCMVDNAESDLCTGQLSLSSRLAVELLG